jgi:hypothetical protein
MTRLGHYGILAILAAGLLAFWLAALWGGRLLWDWASA